MSRLTIIETSDAFRDVWADLADRLDAELHRTEDPAEAAAGSAPLAAVIACGGTEAEAVDVLHAAVRLGVPAPLVVGAEPDHRLAVQLMRRGAGGYYALPGDIERLEEELRRRRDATPADVAEGEGTTARFDFDRIVGEHETLTAALRLVERVIPSRTATVLITGETGTGKELIARAIHDNGPRARAPFVAVNCSAIPANLLESELFGHEKGAFTDARAAKPGLFEVADGGTIFLDEISAMPFELQGKLLRFLETRELRRVGGIREKTVDVRVLAAANVDLEDLIARGAFRDDLFYRLAVVPIRLPPLRHRGRDRVLLARHFLSKLADTYGQDIPELTPAAVRAIDEHDWPGNVRELRNVIERGLLLCDGRAIRPEHLALSSTGGAPSRRPTDGRSGSPLPFPSTLAELEVAAATATLELCEGNKSETARVLGITRSRLYRILERAEGP